MAPVDDLEFLLGKLHEMKELGHLLGVGEELQQLRRAVESAAERARATDDFDYNSLRRLGATNEGADELLEEIWRWHERRRHRNSSRWGVQSVAHAFNRLKFRLDILRQLEALKGEYQSMPMALPPPTPTDKSDASDSSRRRQWQVSSPEAETGIVGRDEDVKNIIWRIFDGKHRNLHIIPIVGMPGIGKTTVAQMVYDHPKVRGNFDLRIWVHVSPAYFDHKLVLRRMAQAVASYDGATVDDDENAIQKLLREKLLLTTNPPFRRRSYLLVLDDVWSEDKNQCDDLKKQLLELSATAPGAQGTVLVTTSRHSVAKMMMMVTTSTLSARRPYLYELQGLSAADCWRLFCRSTSKENLQWLLQQHDDGERRVVEILRDKCWGVPMAAVELAKHMEHHRPPQPLLEPSTLIRTLDGIATLYSQLLPVYFRKCIQFCSLFPADHNYDRVDLDDIWRAQHYAPPLRYTENHRTADLDEIWSEWYTENHRIADLDQIWSEWFFRKSEYSTTDDRVTYYSMHYLMRMLVARAYEQSNGATIQMVRTASEVKDPQNCRHLSLITDSGTSAFPRFPFSMKKLKTLILLREPQMTRSNSRCKISAIPLKLLDNMKNLCVLDLQYTMIKNLPRAIGNLLNLRYLNLSETDITTIPKSVGRLRNLMFLKLVNCRYLRKINDAVANLVSLQKLDLAGCLRLVHVPDTIDNMNQLKCLNIKDCSSLIQMPPSIGQLTNLHTLARYIAGENDGRTITELQTLRGLECELRLECLQKVAGGVDAATAELSRKTMLKKLTLQWKWNHAEEEKATETIQKEVLENLRPNRNLIKLEIMSYMGNKFPSWIGLESNTNIPYLTSLEEIRLFNLKGCQALPPLGDLPRLRIAEISGMDAVTKVDDAFYGGPRGTFPLLQKLTFSQMLKLEKWLDVGESHRRNMFPRLTNLTFINCPALVALEMKLPSVTKLTMWLNNEGLYSSKDALKGLSGSLKKLSISFCEELMDSSECEGLKDLRVLEVLEISGCGELTNLPRGVQHLTSLRSWSINGYQFHR